VIPDNESLVLYFALAERNGVISGPPEAEKSQTIMNGGRPLMSGLRFP
jgi:hypothetical protein